MKQVTTIEFETTDGKRFSDELGAMTHERLIEVRNLITAKLGVNMATTVSPLQAANFIINNIETLVEINKRHDTKMNGYIRRVRNANKKNASDAELLASVGIVTV